MVLCSCLMCLDPPNQNSAWVFWPAMPMVTGSTVSDTSPFPLVVFTECSLHLVIYRQWTPHFPVLPVHTHLVVRYRFQNLWGLDVWGMGCIVCSGDGVKRRTKVVVYSCPPIVETITSLLIWFGNEWSLHLSSWSSGVSGLCWWEGCQGTVPVEILIQQSFVHADPSVFSNALPHMTC